MKRNGPVNIYKVIVAALFCVVVAFTTSAQISFVQVTDPHIFDDTWPEDSRREDKTALVSCINQINERVDAGANYSFVVITGDLGIEALVTGIDVGNAVLVDQRIQQGATELASILAQSKVKLWFFVPGNNDLLNEVPANIKYYHMFMGALGPALQTIGSNVSVVDLCPPDNSGAVASSRSALQKLNDYAFIGFNDSSFKNSKEEDAGVKVAKRVAAKPVPRVEENFAIQKQYVTQVGEHFKRNDFKFAYIFYHVPEIDDPYFVTIKATDPALKPRIANKSLTGNSYLYSSWFVRAEIRDQWNQIVLDPRVKGLFAGHFHDPKRKSYDSFDWILTPSYLPESFSKLHVCPPLALKFQRDKDAKAMAEQARGFQEVYISENGRVASRIVWLTKTGWGLSSEVAMAEAQAAKQLELGQFYERNQQPKDAQTAYLQAADSNWPPTRQRAINNLTRVSNPPQSRLNTYLVAPLRAGWNTGVSALGAVLPALVLVALLLMIAPFFGWIGGKRGQDKLRIGPIAGSSGSGSRLEQVLMMIHGRMIVHYRRRPLLSGPQRLPMLARTQSADVPAILESALPGVLGKVVTWVFKQTDKPRYAITGATEIWSWKSNTLFIAVKESGQYLKTWHSEPPLDEFVGNEIRLAFNALRLVIRRMN